MGILSNLLLLGHWLDANLKRQQSFGRMLEEKKKTNTQKNTSSKQDSLTLIGLQQAKLKLRL